MVRADSFEELHRFLREFRNFADPEGPFDFGGVTYLMLALLDNLKANALPAELDEIGERFELDQQEFFKRIAATLNPTSK